MENKSTCHMTNEMRLIDANERIKWLEDNTTEEEWLVNQYNADWIYSMLEHAPTVDAVEVVRCKDCKHCSNNTPDGLHWCDEHERGSLCDDDFCSYGERR